MDTIYQSTNSQADRESPSARHRHAEILGIAKRFDFWRGSVRKFAQAIGEPESTVRLCLHSHHQRCQDSKFPRVLVEFFDSPQGIDFLRDIMIALHLVFAEENDCGLRNIGRFLQLSGLDEFVSASYGAQQNFASQLETAIAEFGRREDQRLAANMPAREITVCEDETFHPQICLVAIEPVSNFLLLQQYAERRDCETWNQTLGEQITTMAVTVVQVTSDQASALLKHTTEHLGAHHSPDLFHVQHETVQATNFALAGQTRRANETLAKSHVWVVECQQVLDACAQQCPESIESIASLRQQLAAAQNAEVLSQEKVSQCQDRQQRASTARLGISHDYHPIDIESGQAVDADEVGRRLNVRFDELDKIAQEAGLPVAAKEKLAKARRVLPSMHSTILFFWTTVFGRLALLNLPDEINAWLREQMIPGLYLQSAASKASTAALRKELSERAETILARARSPDGVCGRLDDPQRKRLEQQAQACADLFQRSSSCVEGYNGQLSLRHHGLHQLTIRKLAALRVLHNYMVERPDGTTAAERFFGQRPQSLLNWLHAKLSLPGRPRQPRQTV